MPNNNPLKKLKTSQPWLFVLGLIAIGYVSVVEDATMPYRDIAMVKPISKMEVLKPSHKHGFKASHTHKLRGPMLVQWSLIGDQPTSSGDIFELEAVFTSEEPIETINAQLVVPPGVELIKGQKNFSISHLSSGSPQKMRFVFKQSSSRNEQIHLVANGAKSGMRFAESIQFNTLLEPAIKKEKELLLKNSLKEESAQSKVHF